ncbi:MAG: hypothetical protein LAP85_03145 [Acidobacteriia bacterium]|nr:hypothetical protein [Terriglobia bacterium]
MAQQDAQSVPLHSVNPGFDQNVLTLNVGKPFRGFDVAKSISYYHQVLARIRALPGVLSASLASDVPPERGSLGRRMRVDEANAYDNKWHWSDCISGDSWFNSRDIFR